MRERFVPLFWQYSRNVSLKKKIKIISMMFVTLYEHVIIIFYIDEF